MKAVKKQKAIAYVQKKLATVLQVLDNKYWDLNLVNEKIEHNLMKINSHPCALKLLAHE